MQLELQSISLVLRTWPNNKSNTSQTKIHKEITINVALSFPPPSLCICVHIKKRIYSQICIFVFNRISGAKLRSAL